MTTLTLTHPRAAELADMIERRIIPQLGFNMAGYVHHTDEKTPDHSGQGCGTVACIAGWGVAVARMEVPDPEDTSIDFADEAAEWLGIDPETAQYLFYPPEPWETVTQEHAVRVLRKLAATGEVDWHGTLGEVE